MTDYALRLLMHVGRHRERLCTIAEVSQAYGISQAHLMKITHELGQSGWIETVRGKGGGMRLACEPAQINLGELVRNVEPDFVLVECQAVGSACTLTGQCRLTRLFDDALRAFMQQLDGHTLADVLPPARTGDGAHARVALPVPSRRRRSVA
jgi:Rrf2 family transcriptional regulator, nitric oxide-sensitive transcriptional repressor